LKIQRKAKVEPRPRPVLLKARLAFPLYSISIALDATLLLLVLTFYRG